MNRGLIFAAILLAFGSFLYFRVGSRPDARVLPETAGEVPERQDQAEVVKPVDEPRDEERSYGFNSDWTRRGLSENSIALLKIADTEGLNAALAYIDSHYPAG